MRDRVSRILRAGPAPVTSGQASAAGAWGDRVRRRVRDIAAATGVVILVLSATAAPSAESSRAARGARGTVDTTPPVVIVPANATLEATSAAGATFAYSASATDSMG